MDSSDEDSPVEGNISEDSLDYSKISGSSEGSVDSSDSFEDTSDD